MNNKEREIVIKFKVSEEVSDDIQELANILSEDLKPAWKKKIIRWRTGQKALSDRALLLMLDAVKYRNEEHNSSKS